jgi:hypothetical protein
MEGDTRGDAECRGAFTVLVPLVQEKTKPRMGKGKREKRFFKKEGRGGFIDRRLEPMVAPV